MFRNIFARVIHYARPQTKARAPLKFPVTLRLKYPAWDMPACAEFSSAEEITAFLSEPKQFLIDPVTGNLIRPSQVAKIDPNILYEVGGSGLPYREKGLSREQVWDKVFERKAALVLKEALEAEDPNLIELPRVIRDSAGKDVSEWEGMYQLSDGSVVFLEAKYSMSEDHIDTQATRLLESLIAMGKEKCESRLYLAAYYWPNNNCIFHARNKGYGVIQPNGEELTVKVKAEVLQPE